MPNPRIIAQLLTDNELSDDEKRRVLDELERIEKSTLRGIQGGGMPQPPPPSMDELQQIEDSTLAGLQQQPAAQPAQTQGVARQMQDLDAAEQQILSQLQGQGATPAPAPQALSDEQMQELDRVYARAQDSTPKLNIKPPAKYR